MASDLKSYLDKNKISYGAFATRIGVGRSSVYRYAAGVRVPEPDVMIRIYLVTNGAVEPNSFYDLPDLAAAA